VSVFGEEIALESGARCEVAVRDDLVGAPGPSGVVGAWHVASDADASALLDRAVTALAARGVRRVLGPMDGSTWMRYRVALPPASDAERALPPFPGEPTNPPEEAARWEAAGFRTAAQYESALTTELEPGEERARRERERADALRARGVGIRAFDLARWDEELEALHAASLLAFADNLYYAPIGLEAFRALYAPLRALVDPRFVRVATAADGTVLGYVVCYPAPGTRNLVVKTLAAVPEARGTGLGAHLFALAHDAARDAGLDGVIHALMHAENRSLAMSRAWGSHAVRRYALFELVP
jgi:L-amino acid N-acyltransferase YncA